MIEKIVIDYDRICIEVTEHNDREMVVLCNGFIGQELIGFWDEVVVESAVVHEDGLFSLACHHSIENRSRGNLLPSGCPARNATSHSTLVITFIDGCQLRVAAASFETVAKSEDGDERLSE